MFKENKNAQNSFWKIGFGIMTGVSVVLLILFLASPVHTKFSKTIDGEYTHYDTEEKDNVVIHIDGEIQREHHFSKDVCFVGDIRVEFEKNPDMNFKMERENLLFFADDNENDSYSYWVYNYYSPMYDCVYSIDLDKLENGYEFSMILEDEWETHMDWLFAEGSEQEELKHNAVRAGDAKIVGYFD